MKKSIKITLIISIVVILLAVLVGGSVLIVKNWEYISGSMQGETYYTEEDLNNKYNEGYDDASSGTDNYRLLYEEVVKNLSQAQNEKAELSNKLSQVEAQRDQALTQNEIATEKILEHEATITELQNTISQLNETISELQDDLVTLQNEYNDVVSENEDYVDEINSLNTQIVTLSNEVTELKAQLEAYEDMNLNDYYKIEFINTTNDLVVSSAYVRESTKLSSVPTIENTQDTWFYGWSTTEDSTTEFDFTDFVVDNNYTFYSILGDTVPVQNMTNSSEDIYWYGKNLTIGDILSIDKIIDLTNQNIEIVLPNDLTLDSVITQLPILGHQTPTDPPYYRYTLRYAIKANIDLTSNWGIPTNDTLVLGHEVNLIQNLHIEPFSISNIQFTATSNDFPNQEITVNGFGNVTTERYGSTWVYRIISSSTVQLDGYDFIFDFVYYYPNNTVGIRITSDYSCGFIISNISFDLNLTNAYVENLDAYITDLETSYTDFPIYEAEV